MVTERPKGPEIAAMDMMTFLFDDPALDARVRGLRWARDRYTGVRGEGTEDDKTAGDSISRSKPGGNAESACDFEAILDLYHAAGSPESASDRALLAAYWVQVVKGLDQWPSQAVNVELKNLGVRVSNITDALNSLMTQKPSLVVRMRMEIRHPSGT